MFCILHFFDVPYHMNLSGVPNVYLHVHTAGLLSYKFDWTQEMKLHETPPSKKHISSNRAIDSHQRPESSNLLLDIHQFHLAPWVRFSWMTTGLWYDQCWPSSQFMYLLWIVHRMIPQREGTVWDVEVSNQKSKIYPTLLFVLPFYWVSVASPSMARPCTAHYLWPRQGYQLVVDRCDRRPHFRENLCGAKVLHFSQLLIAEFMLITSWMSGVTNITTLSKRDSTNKEYPNACRSLYLLAAYRTLPLNRIWTGQVTNPMVIRLSYRT